MNSHWLIVAVGTEGEPFPCKTFAELEPCKTFAELESRKRKTLRNMSCRVCNFRSPKEELHRVTDGLKHHLKLLFPAEKKLCNVGFYMWGSHITVNFFVCLSALYRNCACAGVIALIVFDVGSHFGLILNTLLNTVWCMPMLCRRLSMCTPNGITY